MLTTQHPNVLKRALGAAAALVAVVGMSGCALVQTSPPPPLTGMAACALGNTWKLDMPKLAEAVTSDLASRGITATVASEGSQTLDWDLASKVVLDTNYTLTVTSGADDAQTIVTDKHSGTSTGIAYINAEVAIPRKWDASKHKVETTATVAGVAPETLPYTLPHLDIDDSVGVQLTCDGNTMTTQQRGSDLVLTWTK